MLLPYYVASMNIEHAYLDGIGEYESFEGICLVDTFQNAGQATFFSTENTKRIQRQMAAPIRVVIGNPPYNMGQQNENEQNKNRRYLASGGVDERVAASYVKASKATLRNKLSDPYVKAFRWATDRIQSHGIVCLVSNNSFIDQIAFDGMRQCLRGDFSRIYLIDLGGNVRKNPKLSGTTHNVFGIQVGVSIAILIRHAGKNAEQHAEILYARMAEDWRKEQRFAALDKWRDLRSVEWQTLVPDERNTWLTQNNKPEFESFLAIGDKKSKGNERSEAIFRSFSLGLVSSRDSFVYNESGKELAKVMRGCVRAYKEALSHLPADWQEDDGLDGIVDPSDRRIKWSRQTLSSLKAREEVHFSEGYIRVANYRPFRPLFHYFDDFWNEERYQLPILFPTDDESNPSICVNQAPDNAGTWCFATNRYIDFHYAGDAQCFPLNCYNGDGANRRENITDWALAEFRSHYGDSSITKRDIFHYTYALLHHPEYRTRYAANLKRELPRIPMAPEFRRYAEIGRELMDIHIHYEQQPEYPLERTETGKLDWRVEKMRLSKDKTQLQYNAFLTLSGIPPEVYEYRLGNRSALEWVIDQYRVSTDKRSGIVNDPNREDDPEYIVRLIGQVVTVSLETVRLVHELAGLSIDQGLRAGTA